MNRMTSHDLRSAAKTQIKGQLGTAILIMLITWLAVAGIPAVVLGFEKFILGVEVGSSFYDKAAGIVSFILTGPIAFGMARFYLNLGTGKEAGIRDVFLGLNCFFKCFMANFFMAFFILLWSLLFIIPGFMAAISYAQTYYILNDYEDLTFLESITLSRVLMHGYKLDYLLLTLTFIGWWLLVLLTFGVAIVFVGPYMEAIYANFYLVLKEVHADAINRFMEQRKHPMGG